MRTVEFEDGQTLEIGDGQLFAGVLFDLETDDFEKVYEPAADVTAADVAVAAAEFRWLADNIENQYRVAMLDDEELEEIEAAFGGQQRGPGGMYQ